MPRPRLDHVRKAQIVAAAAAVLSERGYANTRVVDIAKAAGTSPAAILYWFDGKHGLLAEALALRELEFHDRYTVRVDWQRRPQSSCGSCSKQCCGTTTGHCGWSCACAPARSHGSG